jgi:hypothetical protein
MGRWRNCNETAATVVSRSGVSLVVDQVFHDRCWAKFLADSNGKRALVGASCGAGTA